MKEFSVAKKGDWLWTMMIAQPEEVTPEKVNEIISQVRQKKTLPALDKLRLMTITEGSAAQIMHVGPYSAEGPTLQKLHDWIHHHGYTFDGCEQKHHEIYFGDPHRTRKTQNYLAPALHQSLSSFAKRKEVNHEFLGVVRSRAGSSCRDVARFLSASRDSA